ncbi:hypothetical protein AN220_00600 [Streptomyces nanshensis]|nr:hypothetical protein AN220_00600 [Streptomyces nanshensis]
MIRGEDFFLPLRIPRRTPETIMPKGLVVNEFLFSYQSVFLAKGEEDTYNLRFGYGLNPGEKSAVAYCLNDAIPRSHEHEESLDEYEEEYICLTFAPQ